MFGPNRSAAGLGLAALALVAALSGCGTPANEVPCDQVASELAEATQQVKDLSANYNESTDKGTPEEAELNAAKADADALSVRAKDCKVQATGLTDAAADADQALSLTDDEPVIDCVALVKDVYGADRIKEIDGRKVIIFKVGAWQPQPPRLYSDATNVPLKDRTVKGEMATICYDPAQAAQTMVGLNKLGKVYGKTIGERNPWMMQTADPAKINDWAQPCTTDDLTKHLACQDVMAKTATLLSMFKSEGVIKASSVWNFHVMGATVGTIPEFATNKVQEKNAYWLGFTYTDKVTGCVVRFGYNMGAKSVNGGDQRFAALPCAKKSPGSPGTSTTPPGTTPPGTTPPTNPPSNPPTNPPDKCEDAEKPRDAENIYAPVYKDGCIVKWNKIGSSLNSGPQHQDVQTDRGNQAESQQQSGTITDPPAEQETRDPAGTDGGAATDTGTNSGTTTGGTAESGTPGDADGGDNDTAVDNPFGG